MPVTFSNQRCLNNFIDKNFQDMLLPLDIFMTISQIPKYNCSDGYVTPSSRLQKLKIVIMNIFLLIAVYFRFRLSIVGDSITPDNFIIITLYFDVLHFTLFLSGILIGNIINTCDSTNIVLNIQKAFRTFRFIEMIIRRLTFWIWMLLAILTVCDIMLIGMCFNLDIVAMLLNFLPLILLDGSVLYITCLMCIIKTGLGMWIKELKRVIIHPGKPKLQKVLKSYCLILEAFALFRKISSITVAFLITDIISHTLMYLQVDMDVIKQNAEISLVQFFREPIRISAMMWMTKNYIHLCIFCYFLHQFYTYVKQAEELCCTVDTVGNDEKDVKQLCKNLRRCTDARFTHLRVCGVQVDARLPLRVAGVLATYIVVVLQFNL